ncbi:hypothetical protein B0A48_17618 [Cryoendolithus antarcticus]|uniref:Uncharacterized protein n=1 Tax=Cryoendolithus antarcticus TaxID=1507870 RepID=A0A1V8SB46_9PEZI|nr:hypothetical protein B0A48_17618 [Cryoendolithus antarcticus]
MRSTQQTRAPVQAPPQPGRSDTTPRHLALPAVTRPSVDVLTNSTDKYQTSSTPDRPSKRTKSESDEKDSRLSLDQSSTMTYEHTAEMFPVTPGVAEDSIIVKNILSQLSRPFVTPTQTRSGSSLHPENLSRIHRSPTPPHAFFEPLSPLLTQTRATGPGTSVELGRDAGQSPSIPGWVDDDTANANSLNVGDETGVDGIDDFATALAADRMRTSTVKGGSLADLGDRLNTVNSIGEMPVMAATPIGARKTTDSQTSQNGHEDSDEDEVQEIDPVTQQPKTASAVRAENRLIAQKGDEYFQAVVRRLREMHQKGRHLQLPWVSPMLRIANRFQTADEQRMEVRHDPLMAYPRAFGLVLGREDMQQNVPSLTFAAYLNIPPECIEFDTSGWYNESTIEDLILLSAPVPAPGCHYARFSETSPWLDPSTGSPTSRTFVMRSVIEELNHAINERGHRLSHEALSVKIRGRSMTMTIPRREEAQRINILKGRSRKVVDPIHDRINFHKHLRGMHLSLLYERLMGVRMCEATADKASAELDEFHFEAGYNPLLAADGLDTDTDAVPAISEWLTYADNTGGHIRGQICEFMTSQQPVPVTTKQICDAVQACIDKTLDADSPTPLDDETLLDHDTEDVAPASNDTENVVIVIIRSTPEVFRIVTMPDDSFAWVLCDGPGRDTGSSCLKQHLRDSSGSSAERDIQTSKADFAFCLVVVRHSPGRKRKNPYKGERETAVRHEDAAVFADKLFKAYWQSHKGVRIRGPVDHTAYFSPRRLKRPDPEIFDDRFWKTIAMNETSSRVDFMTEPDGTGAYELLLAANDLARDRDRAMKVLILGSGWDGVSTNNTLWPQLQSLFPHLEMELCLRLTTPSIPRCLFDAEDEDPGADLLPMAWPRYAIKALASLYARESYVTLSADEQAHHLQALLLLQIANNRKLDMTVFAKLRPARWYLRLMCYGGLCKKLHSGGRHDLD